MDAITNEMGIMWHTSRLQWPSFIHANVLSVDRLHAAKEKIINKLSVMSEDTIEEINNRRHLTDAMHWIDECIATNKHDEMYAKFVEFNGILDSKRKTADT